MWYRYFLQRQNKLFVNKYCRRFLHTVIVYRTHVTFIGNGEIINNQIIVDLNKVNPDLKSTMIIHSTGTGTLNISTSDNYKDSIPFCADDGNLAGNYQKITSQNQY